MYIRIYEISTVDYFELLRCLPLKYGLIVRIAEMKKNMAVLSARKRLADEPPLI